jgi:hypothetical protein
MLWTKTLSCSAKTAKQNPRLAAERLGQVEFYPISNSSIFSSGTPESFLDLANEGQANTNNYYW